MNDLAFANDDVLENHTDWYVRTFSDDYLFLYAHRSEEEAEAHVQAAVEHVPFRAGQHVLDIACGAGRHLLAFSKRGACVTGIDLSKVLLENARLRFAQRKFKAEFVQKDMRRIPFVAQFDGVTMWFTSFGYFEKSAEDRFVLAGLSRALKSHGWWWIDLPNPNYIKDTLVPFSKRKIDGPHGLALVHERRKMVGNRVVKTISVEDDLGKRTYIEKVRLYTPERFAAMIFDAGLSADGILGDYSGASFKRQSPRQIWFGRKKEPDVSI
ncbi:MAG: class I SAM-dependent methyltransferase [Deferribacteres bacterium]|nr:class I SAM-dependent methyltransferase [candidate division KSB1 bacterium]MCB9512665.1 class I SAM-dependent methyltransferase [Deferribacteres bacterium]